MDRVDPQSVYTEINEPVQSIFNEKPSHIVAVWPIVVDGRPPGCLIEIGEIGPEVCEIVPFRPKMIVDNIHHHSQSALVARIHQPPQSAGSAVRILDCKRINTVITPVAITGELRYGHKFHGSNSKIFQLVQVRDNCTEGPIRGEGPDMQFVKDIVF